LLFLALGCAAGADLKEAQQRLLSGDYAGCLALARQAPQSSLDAGDWQLLRCQALLATGQYAEARAAITNALAHDRRNIRLCWQAREAWLNNGQTNAAAQMLEDIVRMVSWQPRNYGDAASLVVFGQAVLLKGADPRRVLNTLFASVKQAEPKLREVYLASGTLGLEKHDFALAAREFEQGLKQLPDDADLHCGLARAYAPSDPALMLASLESALQRNSNHVASLLLLADRCIDAEDYAEAERFLARVVAVNPWQPEAWAYRAALAYLRNQPAAAEAARKNALKFWPANPRVEYLIGLKLSQNYRFAEGAAHQRQARQFDPDYLPAKGQLAQDLLRLGEETEGWKLAEEVQRQDGYDVEAYNLATLHETLAKFTTLTNRDFLVRMSRHEADIYGAQVLDLLGQARSQLCAKYGLEPKSPTIVEVFPEQKDFAVRTFGMPGNPGYLGVCFGHVVTANSPAAHLGHPVNWQAMLWHEFCHVVTLQLTRNRMPRWLSEGISVYEEGQANPAWGQRMNPRYREMVLGGDLSPVSKLSAAFLAPRSALHLQFAYYQSALVVEFMVERFGLEQLKAILRDLGNGAELNQALAQHTAPMAKLEADFAAFARRRAQQLAPGLDWTKPEWAEGTPAARLFELLGQGQAKPPAAPPPGLTNAPRDWLSQTNFYALTEQAARLVREKEFQAAKAPLQKLLELYPGQTGPNSPGAMLAEVERALGETNAERQVLSRLAEDDDQALPAYLRLMELGAAAQDWKAVQLNARRYLAVDPLVAPPYRFLAQASERRGDIQTAIQAYGTWLELDPLDPAEVHFRMAALLHRVGDPAARLHLLKALEEAPRHRAALQLLLEMDGAPPQTQTDPTGEGVGLGCKRNS
jgi:tetratricopeptide (TPR) repeat protein